MVAIHAFSDPGGHRHNEDAFRVQTHPLDPDCWLCFVADGQGDRRGADRPRSSRARRRLTPPLLTDRRS